MTRKNLLSKRIFAIILSLAVALSMMPATAFADSDVAVQAAVTTADGNTKQYDNFDTAFETASDAKGSTITLLENVSTKSCFILTKRDGDFTLDLNGKTLDSTNSEKNFLSLNSGTMTIKDSGTGGTINSVNRTLGVTDGALYITGGTFKSSGNYALGFNSGKVQLSGGTFSSETNTYSIWNNQGDAKNLLAEGYGYKQDGGADSTYDGTNNNGVVGKTTVTELPETSVSYVDAEENTQSVTNWTNVTADNSDRWNAGWYTAKNSTTINGNVHIDGEVNLILRDGRDLTIDGDLTFENNAKLKLYWQEKGTGKLIVKTITDENKDKITPVGYMKKTEGVDSTTFEKCVDHQWEYSEADGKTAQTCKLCGKSEQSSESLVVSVTDKDGKVRKFPTFKDAITKAKATEGSTVTLLANVEETNSITIDNGDFTLDLNGNTLTSTTSDSAFLWINPGSKLTIQDSETAGKLLYKTSGNSKAAIRVDGGTLNVTGGTIEGAEHAIYMRRGTLNISNGTFIGQKSNALISNSTDIQLSGGNFSCKNTENAHSIWMMNGKASDILTPHYRYMQTTDLTKESAYNNETEKKGVVGDTTVCAIPRGVDYIDENGDSAERFDFEEVATDTRSLTEGWYAAKSSMALTSELSVSGEVNLILCDGATLTVPKLNFSEDAKLNLYWQVNGSGKLIVQSIDDTAKAKIVSPAGRMIQNDEDSGTTFTKCVSHDPKIEFSDGGATRTESCKNCRTIIKTEHAVAKVIDSGSSYEGYRFTIEGAFDTAKANNNSTLTLLCDITTTDMITVSEGAFTIDLNGHKMEYNGDAGYVLCVSGGALTIKDSGNGILKGSDRGVHVTGGTLIITGGTFIGTKSNGLLVEEENCNVKISGGTFFTENSDEAHSIWVMDNGNAESLLENGYRYETVDGDESGYSAKGNGVVGKTSVKKRPANEYKYIDKDGAQKKQANCTELSTDTTALTGGSWYALKDSTTIENLSVSGTVNLILSDGKELTISNNLTIADGGVLNLYFQEGSSGKLTAKTVSGTVTAPAGEMKQTTGDNGTIFEKCLTHQLEYTQSDDTHTAKCKLCGKTKTEEAHSYTAWTTNNDDQTHTGKCDCGKTMTEEHTLRYTLSADYTAHIGMCSKCGYKHEEKHKFDDTTGKCTVCDADKDVAVAKAQVVTTRVDGTQETKIYHDLLQAFYDADISWATKVEIKLMQSGKTYTLNSEKPFPIKFEYANGVEMIVDLNGCTLKRTVDSMQHGILSVEKGNVTFKNGTLYLDDSAADNPAQAIELDDTNNDDPTLTLENMTIKVADIDTAHSYRAKGYAIRAEGGTLNIKSGTYGKVLINDYVGATAKLSGGSYDSVMCETSYANLLETGYIFANKDDNSYVDLSGMTPANTLTDVKVIKCEHEGDYKDGKCERCGYICTKHEYDGGNCGICGRTLVAKDYTNYYVSLNEAFANVADKAQILVMADLPEETLTFNNNKEVTLELVNHPVNGSADDAATLTVEGGKLTIINGVEGSTIVDDPAVITNNGKGFAVCVTGGTLKFDSKATITGGLQVIKGGKLEGGLKEGSILIAGSGEEIGQGYSVSVRDHVGNTNYGVVRDLLGEGLAFAKYDKDAQTTGDIVSGNEAALTEDVIVVKHTHDLQKVIDHDDTGRIKEYHCTCGFVCKHTENFTNGICNTCDLPCKHEDAVQTDNGEIICFYCKEPFAVQVKYEGASGKYGDLYMQTVEYDSYGNGTENTLKTVFMAAPSGSTVTLLADGLQAWAHVVEGKTITLDLNGKKLIETSNGLLVVTGNKLTVTGEGFSSENDQHWLPCVFNVQGGTLELGDKFGGTFNVIRVGSGTLTSTREEKDSINIGTLEIDDSNAKVSFKQATFGKIATQMLNVSVNLGDLLGENSGKAFQRTDDEAFVPYDTEITSSNAVENVAIVNCTHEKIENDTTCPYCKSVLAATVTKDGNTTGYIKTQDAVNNANGGTVTLLADAEEITVSSELKLDCNEHTITKLTVSNGVTLESLLPEYYAFKSGENWINDSDLSGKTVLENVTTAEAPVKYVRADNPTITVEYGESYTLHTTFAWTGEPNSSARIKWEYKNGGYLHEQAPTLSGCETNSRTMDYTVSTAGHYPAKIGTCVYVVTFTKDGYSKSCEFTVTINKATPSYTVTMTDYTYGTTPSNPTLKDTIKEGTVTYYYNTTNLNEGGVEWNKATTLDAGTYYMYAVIGETTNYNAYTTPTVKFEVKKAKPITGEKRTVTGIYGQKLKDIVLDNPTVNTPGTWKWDAPDTKLDAASNSTVDYPVTFTPNDTTNYEIVKTVVGVKVNPAPGGKLYERQLTQRLGDGALKTFKPDWSGLPNDEVGWTYNVDSNCTGGVTVTDHSYNTEYAELTYKISGGNAGDTVTFTMTAKCRNYEAFTITVVITLTEKDRPEVIIQPIAVTYDGNPVSSDKITGTATFDGKIVEGKWNWKDGQQITNVADSGQKIVVFTPTDTTNYESVEATVALTINKATPTGKPAYDKVTASGKKLSEANLRSNDADGNSLFSVSGTVAWENGDTEVKQGEKYKWKFTPTDTANYTILTGEIILWEKPAPSGGGGGIAPIPPTTEVVTIDKVTTSPAEVKNETKTDADGNKETISKITVSDANQKEIIKQVKDNKSGEIIIEVSEKEVADNAKLEISLDKDFIDSIVEDTDASLTIKTPEGDKTFTQEELKKLTETAEGGKVTIDSSVFDEPTEPSGTLTPAQQKTVKGVKATKIILKSVRTKNGKIRLTWTKSKGYKVDYFEVYRSTKKNSGYGKKPFFTTKDGSWSKYLNTKELKAGKTYYYKVRGVRVINGKKYYTEYSNKAWRKVK